MKYVGLMTVAALQGSYQAGFRRFAYYRHCREMVALFGSAL